ncbi:MAG: PQQ-binding-like beta-propeller repeat protein [Candidatus Solibacter sp.]
MAAASLWAQGPKTDWREYLGGPDSSHFSPLTQIGPGNVSKLQVAWSYEAGESGSYVYAPLVVDNVAFVLAKGGSIVALDAATGKEVWTHSFAPGAARGPAQASAPGEGQAEGAVPARGFGGGAGGARGLNYWESKDRSDRRILIAVSNQLQALDARTGNLIQSFGDHGYVDLRVGLGRDPQTVRAVQSRTPGRVFENLIILGSAPGESYVSPPGHLRAYDVLTGKLVWTFHTVPQPGEPGYETWPKDAYKYIGGTNTWGEISLDEKRGIAYFPLGSPTYDFYGGDRKGDGLYGNCLLALDARTGKHLWHFQLVHHDLWDYDVVAAPQLITVKQNGRTIDAVAQATKQGFLFAFDRVSGKPLFPIEERKTPGSKVPGEAVSPTQPFPTVLPPYGRQRFTADDLDPYYLTDEERAAFKVRLAAARNEGLFTPAGFTETVEMPGNNGGSIYFTTAAAPQQGMVYVIAKHAPSIIKLTENPRPSSPPAAGSSRAGRLGANQQGGARGGRAGGGRGAVTPAQQGRAIYEQNCQLCHGNDLKGSGSAIRLDDIVAREGETRVRETITHGRADMPSFSTMPEASMTALLLFLGNPSAAPPGSASAVAAPSFNEVPYPEGAEHPAVRYYSPYGYETLAINPPWSTLTAYDLNKGTLQWQVPFGDNPAAGPNLGTELRGNLWPKSGVAVTASGLILFASNEGKLRVLNAADGKQLAVYDLPNGSTCVPAIYEVNGREYVLINATGPAMDLRIGPGGEAPPNGRKSYVAFALPSAN